MDLGLAGKVVVVTGATANIGRAIALEMAAEGAKLVASGRDEEAGARVVAEAKERGAAGAIFVPADLSEDNCGQIIRKAAADAFGPVDVLVNNVGGNGSHGLFVDSDPATWIKDIDINYLTMLRVTRAILPDMVARKSGNIVNIGSTAALVGDYMFSVYAGSKGAVLSFTRSLAKEVGQHNIRVNCVVPFGTVADDPAAFSTGSRFHADGFFSEVFSKYDKSELDKLHRQTLVGRPFARPEDVAAAVAYLASERASFTTGDVMTVAGGALL